jgi:polar amino acid transport system substrate-binding protein
MYRRTLLTGAGAAGLVGLSSVIPVRADTMDEVKKRGTLIVGMEVAYVPYEFFKDGNIVGYDPDIIAMAMPKLGVKAQLVDTA